jgi:hypothetical protein
VLKVSRLMSRPAVAVHGSGDRAVHSAPMVMSYYGRRNEPLATTAWRRSPFDGPYSRAGLNASRKRAIGALSRLFV